MYLIQTVQTTWRPQLPLPKELQLTDERHNDEHNTKANHSNNNNSLTTTTTTTTTAATNHIDYPLEEEDMERLRSHHPHQHSLSGSAQQLTGKQKWSFGRLFRKKKDEEVGAECSASSSEEDRKAGFVPAQRQSASKPKAKGKSTRGSNKSLGFDHIVPQGAPPQPPPAPAKPQHVDNEFFLPVEMVPPEPYYQNQPGYYSRSSNSLDRRLYLTPQQQQQQQQQMMLQAPVPPHKSRSAQRGSRVNAGQPHSSEEELISLNSSTFSKYRSDESIHSGGQALQAGAAGQSRRSRAARNERYYKRLSRDGEVSHGGVPVQLQQQQPLPHRYKTQPVPLSIYQAPPAATPSSNTAYVQWQPQSAPRALQNCMQSEGGSKRSISYDSHIHLQNVSGRQQSKPLPPPPPPRDPLRRVQQAAGGSQGHIGASSSDLRPVSYAFDQSGRCVSDDRIWQPPHYQSVHSLNSQPGGSGSIASAPTRAQAQAQAHRRFITRAERNALPGKKSLPNGIDFHYIADATPRSRKPIHMLEGAATPASSGMLRTSKSGLANSSDSWQQQQQQQQAQQTPSARAQPQPQPLAKPRSISSSRLSELRAYPMPMYSEVLKPKRAPPELPAENVICGSLHIKPGEHESQNYVEIRHRDVHKTNSMPHHYQRRSGEDLPNKYEEYVAEKREQHQQAPAPRFTERKASAPAIAPLYFPRKKPANLEEAINELEAIYKSLGLTEPAEAKEESQLEPKWETKLESKLHTKLETKQEPRQEFRQEARQESRQETRQESRQESRQAPRQESRQESSQEFRHEFRQEAKPAPKPRMPTPSDFEKFALAHADDYDDEDSPAGEPDPVLDDVAYRNLQLSNLQHRATEKQPPFGIPVGPIVPAPQSDYLHVEPQTVRAPIARQQQQQQKKKSGSPDIVKDDLAVRALRKDPPGPKSSFIYPMQKKQRATRTQSANIYNLIQRDAAKPSGGDLSSYMELTRSIERAGSMSNLGGTEGSDATTSDIPATLDLLRKLKAQDEELQLKKPATHHIPFRHPSQGGAIAQLPQQLAQDELSVLAKAKAAPVPAPRKSLTPEPLLEDALNKIAQDAQASSIKLSQELHELRKEALITAARPKLNAEQQKLEQELQQIEAVSEAAKRCGQMLLETLPDQDEAPQQGQAEAHATNPRKLHKEGKLIRAIDEVSEAANAVCEKILKDIVTTEPPVVVHEALQVKQQQQEPQLVMPHLIKKLDPIQSDKIEAIAVRCMRQLSELASEATPTATEDHDYDNLTGCNNNMMSNGAATTAASAAGTDATLICPIAEGTSRGKASKTRAQSKSQALDEIDAIMQECERQAKQQHQQQHQTILISSSSTDDQRTTAPSMSSGSVSGGGGRGGGAATTTASSFSSSSDCLAKSSSPSNASRPLSSSITSFNPYSSSDYIKSQSSDYHAPSTDPIKTFSTTSYDVQSTPNNTTASNLTLSTPSTSNNTSNSTSTHHNQHASESLILSSVPKSPSTSPPLQLTPVGERRRRSSSSPSQYNSSEELAAIFGIEEQPKQRRKQQQPQLSTASTGNQGSPSHSSNANPCSTNTRYCAPVIVVVATTTNEPAPCSPDCDAATATATPTNDSARSSSNCSSHNSSKLATIPETEMEQELEQEQQKDQQQDQMETELKLSPNFNRIYASKVNIVVDRTVEPAAEQTQFDSLSSLGEETSSNPDSGNASLADFPLIGGSNSVVGNQANASLELHSAYNTRFEVREHYVSEVSISASDEDDIDGGVSRLEQEFPPLPTEEELLESLREDRELNESGELVEETLKAELQVGVPVTESTEDTKADTKLNEELDESLKLDEVVKELKKAKQTEFKLNEELDEALKLDETPKAPIELLLTEIKPNQELNEELDEASALDEALKLDETATLSDAVYDLASECLKIEEPKELELDEDELDEAELDENELAYNQLVELALDEALLEQTLSEDESIINELNESELDECDGAEKEENDMKRRKSIVYETPQINLSISEVRLNYETKVEQGATTTTTTTTATTTLDEAKQNEDIDDDDDVDDMPIRDTLARNESRGSENETDIKGFPAERERDNKKDEDKQVKKEREEQEEEKPTTSTKALSVFGEVRCVQRRGGTAAAAATATQATQGSLTTLEHVLVACTVGLITPNDLLTLCLIVIGVIIIIAIALN